MPALKTRRSPEEWAILLEEYNASELPQDEFCRQHDLKLSTLTSQLAKRRGERSFVAVSAASTASFAIEAVSIDFPSGLRLTIGK